MTEIATRSAGALAVQPDQQDWSVDQLAALRQLGLGNVSRGVMLQFLTTCQRTGLDPWSRQIYLLPLSGGYQTFTGIDGYRVIARRSNKYRGQTKPEWCGDDGVWVDVWLSRQVPPAAARVGVLNADFDEPIYATALYEEYCARDRAGRPNAMWTKMPANQLAKCAEALALRKAFPNDMAGLLTREEMEQANPEQYRIIDASGPVGSPRPVDVLADEAMDADADQLRTIWREAAAQRQLEIVVADKMTGEVIPLREFLRRRAELLTDDPADTADASEQDTDAQPAAEAEQAVVDVPLPGEGDTAGDAQTDAQPLDPNDPWQRPAGES
jgi:phage recombination protein Bet